MADNVREPQLSYTDFCRTTVAEINERITRGEAVPVAEILARAEQYKELHDFFLVRPEIFEQALEPEGFLKLRDVLADKKTVLAAGVPKDARELPQFNDRVLDRSFPAGPVSPWRVSSLENAQQSVPKIRQKQVDALEIPKLVEKYMSQLKEQQRARVIAEFRKATTAASPDEIQREITARISKIEGIEDKHEAAAQAEHMFREEQLSSRLAGAARRTAGVAHAVAESPDAPPVFTDTLFREISKTADITPEAVNRAAAAARVAVVVNAPEVDLKAVSISDLMGRDPGPVLNALSAIVPGVKEAALQRAFVNTWRKIERSEDLLIQRFGEGVVSSDIFQKIMRDGSSVAVQKQSAGRITSGLGSFIGDIMEPVRGAPDEYALLYLQALYERAASGGDATPSPERHRAAITFAQHPRMFIADVTPSPLEWILRKKAAAGAAAGVSARAGYAAGGKAIGARVAGFLIARGAPSWLAGLIGGPIGWAATAIFAALPVIKQGFSKVVNFIGAGGIASGATRAIAGMANDILHTNYNDWTANKPVILFALALACAPILLVGLTQHNRRLRMSQIVAPSGGLGEEGPGGTPTDCTVNPEADVCNFGLCEGECAWPTSGIITQGPRPSCGSHSGGEDENAIDIAGRSNPGVYAMLDGKVIDVFTGCEDNSGTMDKNDKLHSQCGRGYGNYVIIEGTKGGKTYRIIFGHLLKNVPMIEGQQVTPKTQIGKMDNTGYSSGSHLHFGVMSGGNVLDLLPDNDPLDKASIYGCNSSCTKACPTTPVSSS